MLRTLSLALLLGSTLSAQDLDARLKHLEAKVEALSYELDQARKTADDTQFFLRLGDVAEVEQLLTHLKAAGKTFEARIETDAPGGHSWDRIDTTYARKARQAMFAFLARHLGR